MQNGPLKRWRKHKSQSREKYFRKLSTFLSRQVEQWRPAWGDAQPPEIKTSDLSIASCRVREAPLSRQDDRLKRDQTGNSAVNLHVGGILFLKWICCPSRTSLKHVATYGIVLNCQSQDAIKDSAAAAAAFELTWKGFVSQNWGEKNTPRPAMIKGAQSCQDGSLRTTHNTFG